MKKSTQIFKIIFVIVLLGLSSTIISLYDNVKKSEEFKNERINNFYDIDFQFFTLAMIKEIDNDYQVFSYAQEVPEEIKNMIANSAEKVLNENKYGFQDDEDLVYSIKNTETNQVISNNLDKISSNDDSSKYNFYSKMICDSNGNWHLEGDLTRELFHQTSIVNILERLLQYTNYEIDYETSIITIANTQIPISSLAINQPTNLEITYIVPEHVMGSGYISSKVLYWEQYNEFSLVALIGSSVVLAIFILLYPIKIVREVNPFKTINNWKLEFNVIWLFFAIPLGFSACLIVTGYTLNGMLSTYINKFNFLSGDIIAIIINYITWLLMLMFIAVAIYLIKETFVSGILWTIKEKTLIGSILRYFKNKLDKVSEIDLASPINKKIMRYVLLNSFIIFIIVSFWSISVFLIVIYTFVIFFWLKDKLTKIQKDYNELLEATHQLGLGNFQANIENDLGVFNSLKEEYNNIKIGFKKAVEEETKSQNMKNELISNVSHDLKTPLTCIKNYIVLLQDENISSKTRIQYLNNLNQYTNRLTTLIEDLFEVSKANSGNIQLNLIELNIVALLEQTYTESEDILISKNLTTIKNYCSNDIKLYLDGDKTYRIFENLFTNIAKYAMTNSRVYLDVFEDENEVIITFKNMSATQIDFNAEEIVERFVRGDKSRHEAGSGLGLAIAKSFCEIQGGKFKIEIDGDLFKVIIIFKKECHDK